MVHLDLLFNRAVQIPDQVTTDHPQYHYIAEKRFLTFQQAHDFCLPLKVPIVEIHSDQDLAFYHTTFPDIDKTWLDTILSIKANDLTYSSGKPVPPLLNDNLTLDNTLVATKSCTVINLKTGKITQVFCTAAYPTICAIPGHQIIATKLLQQQIKIIRKLLQKFVKTNFTLPTFPYHNCPNSTEYVFDTLHFKYPFSYLSEASQIDPYTLYTTLLALKHQVQTWFSLTSALQYQISG